MFNKKNRGLAQENVDFPQESMGSIVSFWHSMVIMDKSKVLTYL
jgi:lysophospholipid acyltransferase (LPLAT)-like uncharacterized protein